MTYLNKDIMNKLKFKRIISVIVDTFFIGLTSYSLDICLIYLGLPMSTQISIMLFYFLFACKDCYNGMSLGKYIFKIQIIDNKTLKAASPFKCLIRNYLQFAFIIELIIMLCNTQGHRIGDYITSTTVVPFKKQQTQINLKSTVIVVGLVFVLSIGLLLWVKKNFY